MWIDTGATNGRYPTNVGNVRICANATYGAIRGLGDNLEVGSVGIGATNCRLGGTGTECANVPCF